VEWRDRDGRGVEVKESGGGGGRVGSRRHGEQGVKRGLSGWRGGSRSMEGGV
jgi:hypothetical protein